MNIFLSSIDFLPSFTRRFSLSLYLCSSTCAGERKCSYTLHFDTFFLFLSSASTAFDRVNVTHLSTLLSQK